MSLHELLSYYSDEPSGVDVKTGAVIHEVLWDTDMHLPTMRKLVNETCCKYSYKSHFRSTLLVTIFLNLLEYIIQ